LASGIHTSILMSESVDGFNVAATRQNAGSCLKSAAGSASPRPVTGDENAPAATDCANVIVVFGNESGWSLSQTAARDAEPVQRAIRMLKAKRCNAWL
jgi:hypothetical protein